MFMSTSEGTLTRLTYQAGHYSVSHALRKVYECSPKFPSQRDPLFAFLGVDVLKERGGDTLPLDDSVNYLLEIATQRFGSSVQDGSVQSSTPLRSPSAAGPHLGLISYMDLKTAIYNVLG